MHKGRIAKACGWMGLGLLVGVLVYANGALAQMTILRNPFESKLGWTKGGFDAPHDEIAHRIDDRDPHSGRGCEYLELNVKPGKFLYYAYPVGKAPITDELRAALWLKANRPGIQLMARVVLPREADPNNLGYRMTTYIKGDTYQQAGQWKSLEVGRPVMALKVQQQLLNTSLNRPIDITDAYIDALLLNVYAGPGATQVWIDDLEIGPVMPGAPFQTTVRPGGGNPAIPAAPNAAGQRGSVVEFNNNRLMVGTRRLFPRAVNFTDTDVDVLHNAGFTTICFPPNVKSALVKQAMDLGMWIAPEFRIVNDAGAPLSDDEITRQINVYADNDAVIYHRIGGLLAYEQGAMVARAAQVARTADPGRPLFGEVWDGLLPYSRTLNVVGTHRFPLMTTLELPKYREWLESRRRLANPGVFTFTWIQTHMPDGHAALLYNQSAQAEFHEPVGPQAEQIRLLAYTALASGCRGLGYWSDRFLADSHQGRDRLLSCALVNQEMDMIESMLVTVEDTPQWIDTSVPQVKAAVFRCAQGVLAIPMWQGSFAQLVPGQASVARLNVVVPQVPATAQAWEISPGDVRSLKLDRVEKGVSVVLPEFGLTSIIVFTSDTNMVGRFQDQARARRKNAAQWSYDMALYELEKVVKINSDLEQVRVKLHDANSLIEDGKKRLRRSKELWDAQNFSEAYHEAERALRPIRILMRAHWEKAVRGLDTPVASPYAVSFFTLPRHWTFMEQVKAGAAGSNVLPGGDFEIVPERVQDAWKLDRISLDDVELSAERVRDLTNKRSEPKREIDPKEPKQSKEAREAEIAKEKKLEAENIKKGLIKNPVLPAEGQQCAMLQIKPHLGKPAPVALERTLVALTSPNVTLPPGMLVQISAWVNIPAPITASADGALIYDSAGGEPMAIRLTEPTMWKKFTVYRRVPASGTINVTLALTGVGAVYFDDVRIEPLVPPGSVAGGIRPVSGQR